MANYFGKFYLDDWMRDLVEEETWNDGTKHKFVRVNVVEMQKPRVSGNFTTTHFIASGAKREIRDAVLQKTGRKSLVFGDLTVSNYGNSAQPQQPQQDAQPIAKIIDKMQDEDDGLPF